ncbi:MAG: hypothetical protein JWQ09_2082 [Segetibacter sp.]|nr:hypothetical protein [Segetibacter sp.]
MKNKYTLLVAIATLVYSSVFAQSMSFTTDQSHFMDEDLTGNYTVVQKPSLQVVGIECRICNSPVAGPCDISKHWAKFYNEDIIHHIPNKTSDEVIALYCDYEGDYMQPYSFVIGCPVSSFDVVPEGMVAKTIPAGFYGFFRAVGDYPTNLIETWSTIWRTDLQRTYRSDYEVYGNKFISDTSKEVEIYIGLASSNRE